MDALVNSSSLATQHIFIIDDSEAITKLLNIMLSKMGYSTYVYHNALDFLKAIPDVSPSILITDMNIPNMTGIELQDELIRLERTMPVIFISGESTVPQSVTALKHGAVDFLVKPVNKQQLTAAVESAFKAVLKNNQYASNKTALALKLKILSPRERETYDLLILGYNNAELLNSLNLSLPTIKQYKAEVMRKLQIGSLSELIDLQKIS
jgi:FixJ family two-component response regulator